MSGTDTVLAPPHLLRVQSSSKLAFGATTAALVTLASGGTALLVTTGTSALVSPSALPAGSLLADAGAVDGDVVVDRAPGTFGESHPVPVVLADPTERALLDALARRAPVARRITAPLVELPAQVTPVVPPVLPEAPPVVVTPPLPPVPETPDVPVVVPVRPGPPAAHSPRVHPVRPGKPNAHHEAKDKRRDTAPSTSAAARRGRHAR